MGSEMCIRDSFEMGTHQAFLASFAVTLVAALASYLRPSLAKRSLAL